MKKKIQLFYIFTVFLFGSFLFPSHSVAVLDKLDGFGVPGIDTGVFFGLGQQEFRASNDPESEAYSFGLYALTGVSLFPGIKLGPYGEYHSVKERKSIAGAEAFDGSGYLLGFGLSLNIAPFYALAAYTLFGKYSRDGPGNRSFSDPQGVHGLLGFYISPFFSIDASYGHIQYAEEEGDRSIEDDKFRWRTFRLSFSLHL